MLKPCVAGMSLCTGRYVGIDNLGAVMQRSSEVNVDNSSNLVVVKKRNWHFELLRIISMFLIVATHYFAEDDWAVRIDPTLSRS